MDNRSVVSPHNINEEQASGYTRPTFTPEELRVLRECNRESFWYRSVPLGSALAALAYMGVKSGRFSGSARFGAAPKMFSALALGYIVGKVSYQTVCVDKILQLPNSPMAERLRKARGARGGGGGGVIQETLGTLDPGFYTSSGPTYQGTNMDVMDTRPISNFDTESSSFVGFDKQGDTGLELLDEDELPPKPSQNYSTTYDNLRQQNRIDYERQRYVQHPPQQDRRAAPQPVVPVRSPSPSAPKAKNVYGDVWDDVPPTQQ